MCSQVASQKRRDAKRAAGLTGKRDQPEHAYATREKEAYRLWVATLARDAKSTRVLCLPGPRAIEPLYFQHIANIDLKHIIAVEDDATTASIIREMLPEVQLYEGKLHDILAKVSDKQLVIDFADLDMQCTARGEDAVSAITRMLRWGVMTSGVIVVNVINGHGTPGETGDDRLNQIEELIRSTGREPERIGTYQYSGMLAGAWRF